MDNDLGDTAEGLVEDKSFWADLDEKCDGKQTLCENGDAHILVAEEGMQQSLVAQFLKEKVDEIKHKNHNKEFSSIVAMRRAASLLAICRVCVCCILVPIRVTHGNNMIPISLDTFACVNTCVRVYMCVPIRIHNKYT